MTTTVQAFAAKMLRRRERRVAQLSQRAARIRVDCPTLGRVSAARRVLEDLEQELRLLDQIRDAASCARTGRRHSLVSDWAKGLADGRLA